MVEIPVLPLDSWDCLVLGELAGSAAASLTSDGLHAGAELLPDWPALPQGGPTAALAGALRRLGLRVAFLASFPALAASTATSAEASSLLLVSLGEDRPATLLPLLDPAGGPRALAAALRPLLLQSRWIHGDGALWSLPLLREACVRGLATSLAVPVTLTGDPDQPPRLQPRTTPELAEHLRYALSLLLTASGQVVLSPQQLAPLLDELAHEGEQEVLLYLPGRGALLREERGERTWHAARAASGDEPAGPLEEVAWQAGYLAGRRLGARPRRAVVWGLVAGSRAREHDAATLDALPTRLELEDGLQRTSWEPRILPGGPPPA